MAVDPLGDLKDRAAAWRPGAMTFGLGAIQTL